MYYLDNGQYPGSPNETGGSETINSGWSTTADGSWQRLIDTLKPYVSGIGADPISSPGIRMTSGEGYNYAYFASSSDYCGAAPYQMYMLTYKLEGADQKNDLIGLCPTNPLIYAPNSNYRAVKTLL